MIDLTFLEKFTKGNTAKMKRYIGMYLDIAPGTFKQMQENLDNQNWEQLAINAHSLKPQTDYMGVADLKEILIEIENNVKSGHFGNLEELYNKALSMHTASEIHLNNFLKSVD